MVSILIWNHLKNIGTCTHMIYNEKELFIYKKIFKIGTMFTDDDYDIL
jgi:hypothetical protein